MTQTACVRNFGTEPHNATPRFAISGPDPRLRYSMHGFPLGSSSESVWNRACLFFGVEC